MRALFDIVHPADVLFFKRPIEMLLARGDEVLVVSRTKDIACDLLDAFDIPHKPISSAGRGLAGLARELITRDIAMLKHVRSFKPEVMVGFGGVSVAHAGWLTQTPSISFYDSENASLQNRITLPFISKMYVPESYSGPTPKGRTVRLKGTKDLSYLHPGAFKPDRDKAIAAGLDPDKDNFFIRIVAWRANHDLGKHGWSDELLQSVITRLSEIGRVHISSEENLPGHLSEFEYKGPKQDVHHVLACCRLMVGESATMACECGLLGTPAIYAGRDFPAYTADMENAGLITNFRNVTEQSLLPEIERWLKVPPSNIIAARDAYARACPDWGLAVVEALDAQRR